MWMMHMYCPYFLLHVGLPFSDLLCYIVIILFIINLISSTVTDVETVVDSFVYCSDITCAAASSQGDMVAIGLQKGLTSVIDLKVLRS